jgi:hypothetical protein
MKLASAYKTYKANPNITPDINDPNYYDNTYNTHERYRIHLRAVHQMKLSQLIAP